jgi:hypothetical protein
VLRLADRPATLALRIAGTILGGYALAAGGAGLGAVLMARAGMAGSEAALLATMCAFIAYLAILVAGFAARRPLRFVAALAVLAGGAIVLADALAPTTAAA